MNFKSEAKELLIHQRFNTQAFCVLSIAHKYFCSLRTNKEKFKRTHLFVLYQYNTIIVRLYTQKLF